MKKLSLKEKVEYLRIGMGLVGIPTNNMTAELIVRLYQGICQKGGSFNLEDAAKIEVEVTGKYTEKEVKATQPETKGEVKGAAQQGDNNIPTFTEGYDDIAFDFHKANEQPAQQSDWKGEKELR